MGFEKSQNYIFDPRRGNNYGVEAAEPAALVEAYTLTAGGCPSCGRSAHMPTLGPEALPESVVQGIVDDHMSTLDAELDGLTAIYGPEKPE